jgi:predicted flap endonuclease-1-like 5' DNA nuclease/regulator of replication initiation timing
MENLFESLNHPDSVFFLFSVLMSFLIGFVAAWLMWRGQANRFQREAADWKKKYDDLHLELTALREKHDLSLADLAKSNREADLALEQLAALQAEKAKWQKDYDASLEETVRLQASSHSYQSTIEDLNNQIIGLKTRNEQLAAAEASDTAEQQQLVAMKVAYDETSGRVSALEGRIAELMAENESLRSNGKKEDENLINLLNSYKDSTNRLGALEANIGSLVSENDALKTELAALKSAAAGVAVEAPVLEALVLGAVVDAPIIPSINPADKEAITSGTITPSDAKDEVLAAIGTTIPVATADQKDDLTAIKGIGSFLEKKLNGLGIYTYDQISHLDANLIEKLTAAIEFFPGRIERDDWVGQAKLLAKPATEKPAKTKAKPKAKTVMNDDLKIIEGIGPKIELLLNGAGIHSFAELADTQVERLKEVLTNAGDRFRMHDPSTWPEQARLAAEGDMAKLKNYQEFLSGGRVPGGEG